ncbi:MAG TPA: hypothetical protein VFY93_03195 [Planctomycetota bacterium]|nr:hypothetical protein [Planctomycetota bacterium]
MIRIRRAAPLQRGFALVEVLTAGLVLALAALGLSATLANGSRLADGSREEMLARDAIRDTLARIAETPFDKVALNFHHGRFSAGPLPAVTDDPDGWPGEILFEPGPEDSRDVYRVTLRMRWKGAGGERVIESVHYLANVRGDPGVVPTMDEVEQAIAAR